MARINAFRAVRPTKEVAAEVASFPYDVLNSEEARQITVGNANSFLHVVKPEIDLPPETDLYDPSVYEQGRKNLYQMIEKGVLFQEEVPTMFFYRQIMGEHSQTGLVACCHIDDYLNNVIKKHEHTRADKELDRITHVRTTNANTGPVFLTYPSVAKIQAITEKVTSGSPEYDFTSSDGIQHTVWVISSQADLQDLTTEFAKVPALYVADGHHRSASAAKVGESLREAARVKDENAEYNWFLSVIFPHDQLMILDYNRAIKDICGMTPEEFMETISQKFEIIPITSDKAKPTCAKQFGMYIEGQWYQLTARPDSFDTMNPVASLDVAILQNNLLHPILRIDDPRTDKRIHFIGGIRGMQELVKLVDSGNYKVAFSLYPTSIEELMNIADADKVMPPKSTWFEPKLRSGLFVHLLK
jgi:uncharacterized protein (DUF1015 family)